MLLRLWLVASFLGVALSTPPFDPTATPGIVAQPEDLDRQASLAPTWHGGPVMKTPVAYIIWYGTWTTASKNLVLNFVKNIGATAWWRINNAYSGVGPLTFGAAADDAYSQGRTFTSNGAVWSVVQNAFNRRVLPQNSNGIYLVLSSSDVTISGFCSNFCGWHSYAGSYKFAWIGVPASGCNCFAQSNSPNGNPALDSAISVIAHELAEAVTDPNINAWYNINKDENADICAWNFVGRTWSGSYFYNIVVGGLRYYVQSNYNLSTKVCAMS